jgi:hypothetical protein
LRPGYPAPETLRTWAGAPVASQLEELRIDDVDPTYALPSRMAEDLLAPLLARSNPLRLRSLVLRRAALTTKTLSALLSSGVLPELQGIAFSDCELPKGWIEILARTTLPKLRAIGLSEALDEDKFGPLMQRFGEDGIRWEF